MWEFPGGKVESGETPKAALIREIEEELAASIDVGPEVLHASGAWPISEMYEMRLFFAAVTDGEPTAGNSHDQLRWIAPADLDALDWLPSDTGAIASIQARLASWIP